MLKNHHSNHNNKQFCVDRNRTWGVCCVNKIRKKSWLNKRSLTTFLFLIINLVNVKAQLIISKNNKTLDITHNRNEISKIDKYTFEDLLRKVLEDKDSVYVIRSSYTNNIVEDETNFRWIDGMAFRDKKPFTGNLLQFDDYSFSRKHKYKLTPKNLTLLPNAKMLNPAMRFIISDNDGLIDSLPVSRIMTFVNGKKYMDIFMGNRIQFRVKHGSNECMYYTFHENGLLKQAAIVHEVLRGVSVIQEETVEDGNMVEFDTKGNLVKKGYILDRKNIQSPFYIYEEYYKRGSCDSCVSLRRTFSGAKIIGKPYFGYHDFIEEIFNDNVLHSKKWRKPGKTIDYIVYHPNGKVKQTFHKSNLNQVHREYDVSGNLVGEFDINGKSILLTKNTGNSTEQQGVNNDGTSHTANQIESCFMCNGKGTTVGCSRCTKGNIHCRKCGGRGLLSNYQKCLDCVGRGIVKCESCRGNYINVINKCYSCDGCGKRKTVLETCWSCRGSKYSRTNEGSRIICGACNGTGLTTGTRPACK